MLFVGFECAYVDEEGVAMCVRHSFNPLRLTYEEMRTVRNPDLHFGFSNLDRLSIARGLADELRMPVQLIYYARNGIEWIPAYRDMWMEIIPPYVIPFPVFPADVSSLKKVTWYCAMLGKVVMSLLRCCIPESLKREQQA